MARLLVVSCLVACCAALQPSLILSARTAQAAQRTAAPVMKRPDYFLRVSRSEAGRPRLCVFRSNKNIYAQIIDDSKGVVLCSASTKEKGMDAATANGSNCQGASEVGKRIGARALEAGIQKVHFDRNGRVYHGRVKSVAEGAREAGLAF